MKPETSNVIHALLSDNTVASIIGSNIFCDQPPSEAAFPCVTYQESITPVLRTDNASALMQNRFVMECWQRESAWEMAAAITTVMESLGYMQRYANSAGMTGAVHQVSMEFVILREG